MNGKRVAKRSYKSTHDADEFWAIIVGLSRCTWLLLGLSETRTFGRRWRDSRAASERERILGKDHAPALLPTNFSALRCFLICCYFLSYSKLFPFYVFLDVGIFENCVLNTYYIISLYLLFLVRTRSRVRRGSSISSIPFKIKHLPYLPFFVVTILPLHTCNWNNKKSYKYRACFVLKWREIWFQHQKLLPVLKLDKYYPKYIVGKWYGVKCFYF